MSEQASADEVRSAMRESWEAAAEGWGRRADDQRAFGMPVSEWLIDHAGLGPGQRVLELAAGAGDTGFLAAELIAPGGTLVCSDGAEAMVAVARERAAALGIRNVEFQQLELEWIDLPAASVDVILCRWGLMFTVDPGAALRECRRVLKPGGRLALAVWDVLERNPWMGIPSQALAVGGHAEPLDPSAPGPFALASAERLQTLLEDAGFVETTIEAVAVEARAASLDAWIDHLSQISRVFSTPWRALDTDERSQVRARMAELAAPYTDEHGALRVPGVSLAALAE